MQLEEKEVILKKLIADKGKIIISKETKTDDKGNKIPTIQSKEIYLGCEDSEENYIEIEEKEVQALINEEG